MRAISVATFVTLLAFIVANSADAGIVNLSFSGAVDGTGYTVGGVPAPVGSPFTLNLAIDDSLAFSGVYDILGASYTLTVGTYTTVTNWTLYGDLVATQMGSAIVLDTSPQFISPNEHLLVDLQGFGPSSFSNPLTWGGPALLTGDIIVRGIGGFVSPDQLSGDFGYTGTLLLSVSPAEVPEPASVALFGLGGLGLVAARRRRQAA